MSPVDEPALAAEDSDTFERFLTAAIVTRFLGNKGRPVGWANDIEDLIQRLAGVLRSAAGSVTGTCRDCSDALPRHKVRAVAAHVARNLDRPIRVADLAAIVNISPHHFSRQFRVATGLAPHQYVRHCRMRRAAQLLIDTEMSICSVSIEVGCVDQSHFSNVFRQTFGCTPREFQRSAVSSGRCGHSAGAHEGAAALVSCTHRCGPGETPSARGVRHLRFDRPFTTTQELQ